MSDPAQAVDRSAGDASDPFQQLLDAADVIIAKHNAAISRLSPSNLRIELVDPAYFHAKLILSGATEVSDLRKLRYEQIDPLLMPAFDGVRPAILAKKIADLFRGPPVDYLGIGYTAEASGPVEKFAQSEDRPSSKKARNLTPRQLLEAFDSSDSESSVGRRLTQLAKGQAFLIYQTGRALDVEGSLKLLNELTQGYPSRQVFKGRDDVLRKVYRVGELPDAFAEENPIYAGRPLRPDGTCDQTQRSWEGVPMEVRQLVRLAIKTGELKREPVGMAHDILDLAIAPDAERRLRERCPKAAFAFDDNPDQRPRLSIRLGEGASVADGRKGSISTGTLVSWDSTSGNGYRAR